MRKGKKNQKKTPTKVFLTNERMILQLYLEKMFLMCSMKNKFLFTTVIIFSLFFSSCFLLTGGVTFDEDNFEKEYALWKENNPKNYSFEYRYRSDSGRVALRITVHDEISSFESLVGEVEVKKYIINSIDDVFELIKTEKKEYEESKEKDYVYDFSMSFDETYHYPTEVSIDAYHKKWWKYIDEFDGFYITIKVSNFTILE